MSGHHAIPDAALAQHIAILGKTGSGKTSTEKLIVEHVVAEEFRVCVLDTIKSDWWGIISSATGKSPGLPFKILGGPHGHVPLHSSAGKAIGHLVGAGKLPLSIIDMADFEAGGIQRFFVDFAQSLWKHARGVLYLVIEEAHELAPKERAGFGAENMSIHWAKKLATGSRTKGIRLIVATQSIQSLHNSVLGSCDTMIAHRLTSPAHQEPVMKWLKANADKETTEKVAASLSSLPDGTGWLCAGQARVFEKIAFPKFHTYDNNATPTGDTPEIAVKAAPVDQDELRAIIGDAVKEAEANDPKALKKQITDLQRQMREASAAASKTGNTPDPQAIEDAEKRGFDAGVREYQGKIVPAFATLENAWRAYEAARVTLGSAIEDFEIVASVALEYRAAPAAPPRRTVITPAPKPRAAAPPLPKSNGQFTGPQHRVLRSLAMWKALGHTTPSREMVAAASGYSPSSGGFNNLLGGLATAGAIGKPMPGHLSLLVDADEMSADEGRDMLLGYLSNPQRKLVDALNGADDLSRDELGAATGYSPSSGGFNNLIGSLSTLGLITKPTPGYVALSDWAQELLT